MFARTARHLRMSAPAACAAGVVAMGYQRDAERKNVFTIPVQSSTTKCEEKGNFLKDLPQNGKILAEYVWLGASGTTGGFDMRSKTMTIDFKPKKPGDLRIWNYDGSSTGQAPGNDSEVLIRPVAIFPDPFRRHDNIIVFCDTIHPVTREPIATNTRAPAKAIFDKKPELKPWFGIEQEYTLMKKDGLRPLGFPDIGRPPSQGPYYCGAGYDSAIGRDIADAHLKACCYAGITISGINAEVMPGQWEFQIGPCEGIDSGDHLWLARYLMVRICEELQVNVTFDPKPMSGDWNGAGCHTNYSTEPMRKKGGYPEIIKAIKKLQAKHDEHIRVYGEGNERRLTGAHETAPITAFSYGVANRGASVRIPREAEINNCGYFEDRRPASNMDPYVVTSKVFETTCL